MSTSLLYRAFGIRGYRYRRTDYRQGCVVVSIEQPRESLRCPCCRTDDVERRGHKTREWQTLSIGGKPVFVRMDVPRVHCRTCGITRQVTVPFSEPQRSHTRAFGRHVLELRESMTIRDVAQHLGVSWWLVKDIEKRYLGRVFSKPKLRHLKRIAIDEISIGKGHRYLTIVLDLESGAIVHVSQGKGMDALKPFWRSLKVSRAGIEAVATDTSRAYIQAVSENLPDATLVFDRFHLVKLFNEKLSDLRRQLYREATEGLHRRRPPIFRKTRTTINDERQQ